MSAAFDEATLGPDGWECDATPNSVPVHMEIDSSGNPIGLVGPDGVVRSVPYTLLQGGVPIGIAPTGTMGANGAVTLGTALNTTYSGGVWLYYAAGAVYAGSAAGFYWCVMSSTTVGTVYNNIYVPGTSSFGIPASPTAIVAAGPGAFTGVTSSITAISANVLGNSLGVTGSLEANFLGNRNSAGTSNVNVGIFLGGTDLQSNSGYATTQLTLAQKRSLYNCGRADRNIAPYYVNDGLTSSSSSPLLSINTAIDQSLQIKIQLITATDAVIINAVRMIIFPS